jgi:hypothetical protein
MKAKALISTGLLLAGFLGGCAYPANPPPTVVVAPPPPPMAEVIPGSPGPGYYWVRGHWAWRYGRYVWVRGHWIARAGHAWVEGHYENRGGSYIWIEGQWR